MRKNILCYENATSSKATSVVMAPVLWQLRFKDVRSNNEIHEFARFETHDQTAFWQMASGAICSKTRLTPF